MYIFIKADYDSFNCNTQFNATVCHIHDPSFSSYNFSYFPNSFGYPGYDLVWNQSRV